jgi:hypothetical protein
MRVLEIVKESLFPELPPDAAGSPAKYDALHRKAASTPKLQ